MMSLLPLLASWLLGALLLGLDGRKRWVTVLATLSLVAVFLMDAVALFSAVRSEMVPFELTSGGWPAGVGIRLHVDGLSLLFSVICSGVLVAVMIYEARAEMRSRIFPALLLLLSTGLHGAFFTGDLFNFYVFFELAMVASFALAAYGYGRAEIRGTFIYIALNLLGSVLFLIGVAGVYHAVGTLDLQQIAARVAGGAGAELILPASMLFVALSVKLGLFPFHSWVPVLYSHAHPAVASAMTGALVNLGAYGMLRFGFTALAEERREAAAVLVAFGAVAALYGSLLALRRKEPAEITAYAAIAHAGFVVLGLGIGGVQGILAVLLTAVSGSIDKSTMLLSAYSGAGRFSTLAAACSVAGLPITIGFVSKVQLYRAALDTPGAWAVLLALFTSSTLLLAGAFRFWRLANRARHSGGRGGGVALVMASFIVLLGVWPEPSVEVARRIAVRLIGGGG